MLSAPLNNPRTYFGTHSHCFVFLFLGANDRSCLHLLVVVLVLVVSDARVMIVTVRFRMGGCNGGDLTGRGEEGGQGRGVYRPMMYNITQL